MVNPSGSYSKTIGNHSKTTVMPSCCVYLCPPPIRICPHRFRKRQISLSTNLSRNPRQNTKVHFAKCSKRQISNRSRVNPRQKHKLHFCISRVVFCKSALCVFVEESSTYLSRNPRQNTKVYFAHIDLARCTFVFCRGMLDRFEICQGNPRQISNLSFPDKRQISNLPFPDSFSMCRSALCVFCRGFAF